MTKLKVFSMPFVLDTKKTIPVILVPKTISFKREDQEHILALNEEDDVAKWEFYFEQSAIFEVYPDEESFHNRALPITYIQHSKDLTEEYRNKLPLDIVDDLVNKKDEVQDYSKGKVIYIDEEKNINDLQYKLEFKDV